MVYSISRYPVTDEDFSDMKRKEKRSCDCFINLLEVLKILDPISAGILRIVRGHHGLTPDEIVKIFDLAKPPLKHNLNAYRINEGGYHYFYNDISRLKPGEVSVVGMFRKDGSAHAFFIGRSIDKILVIADPQINKNRYIHEYLLLKPDEANKIHNYIKNNPGLVKNDRIKIGNTSYAIDHKKNIYKKNDYWYKYLNTDSINELYILTYNIPENNT